MVFSVLARLHTVADCLPVLSRHLPALPRPRPGAAERPPPAVAATADSPSARADRSQGYFACSASVLLYQLRARFTRRWRGISVRTRRRWNISFGVRGSITLAWAWITVVVFAMVESLSAAFQRSFRRSSCKPSI